MKILIVSFKNPFAARDGGSLAILNVLKGYKSLGFEVTLLMMNPSLHYIALKDCEEKIDKLGINVISFDIDTRIKPLNALSNLLFSKLPYNLERFKNANFEEKLKEIITENNYDLVQFEGSYLGLFSQYIKEYSPNSKLVLRSHNIEYEIWERNAQVNTNLLKKKYFRIIAKRFKKWEEQSFSFYDAIIPITNRDLEKIKKICPEKNFHTLPFTIDINKYEPLEIYPPKMSIAYLGALDWIPNQEGLIWFLENVWRNLEKKYKEIDFYIAGKNAPEWLIHKLDKFGIKFLGEIPDAKEYILEHPIFVVPLFSGSGMRIKLIEQMALQRVVLATSIAAEGIEIIHGKNGFICNTPETFIRTMETLLSNSESYYEIAKNARITVISQFDEKEAFGKVNSFLDSL